VIQHGLRQAPRRFGLRKYRVGDGAAGKSVSGKKTTPIILIILHRGSENYISGKKLKQ
jgi:hypothetical protein